MLERLCEAAENLPGPLLALTGEIQRTGLIRPRPSQPSFFLDTGGLSRAQAARAWHWVAARELAAFEPALIGGAKLAAWLAPWGDRELVAAVVAGYEKSFE